MNFLQRLAPARPGDPTRAVAAMPPRFESERPLRDAVPIAPSAGGEMDLGSGESEQPAEPERMGPVEERQGRAIPLEARQARAIPQHESADWTQVPRPPTRSSDAPASGAGGERARGLRAPKEDSPAIRAEPRSERNAPRPLSPPPPRGSPPSDPKPSPLAPMTRAPHRVQPATMAQAQPVTAAPADTSSSSTPLSKATLAVRASHGPEPRPVIHVTIDRIEVRAPAAAPRSAPPSQPAPAPGVSLGDYLRGNTITKNGGAHR
jgi:hypothetical protein